MSVVDVTDFSDEEGEVPPLLGPSCAATPTVASKPAAVPKKPADSAQSKPTAAAPPPAAQKPSTAQKPGANLKASTGLKKGFLGGGGGGGVPSSSRPNKAGSSASGSSSDGVPMVRADADAKAKSLQLPEVQSTMEAQKAEAAKLGAGGANSWMTPDLLKKIAANPLLRKGFGDPRCQAAMAEMQTDPQAAMRKYGDQPEMRSFLQAFMKLMGEHFSSLADKQDEEKARAGPALTPEEVLTPEQKKAQEVAQRAMSDPEVRAIVAEPKIQELLATMQSGKPFELEKAMRTDPEVVKKLKKLKEAGLINMEWKA